MNGGKMHSEGGVRELAHLMIQEQVKNRGKNEQQFELFGTQALNLYRQAVTPITGDRRSLGQ